MKLPIMQLKPGDQFKIDGVRMVRVANCGEANCADLEIHTLVKLPYDTIVEVPPYEPDYTPTPDEIAEQSERDAKGIRMLDRIKSGEFDFDKEQD